MKIKATDDPIDCYACQRSITDVYDVWIDGDYREVCGYCYFKNLPPAPSRSKIIQKRDRGPRERSHSERR